MLLSSPVQSLPSNSFTTLLWRKRALVFLAASLSAILLLRSGSGDLELARRAAAARVIDLLPAKRRRLERDHVPGPVAVFSAPYPATLSSAATYTKPLLAQVDSLETARLPLADFLRTHIGPPDVDPHGRAVWITLADARYVQTAVSHMARYLSSLPSRPALPTHDLLVLCIDLECVEEANRIGALGYAGFVDDPAKPEFVRKDTHAKANGLAQVLRAGYHVVFADADVFFKRDVFEGLKGIEDPSWDLQIQDESHRGFVNTGFWYARASEGLAELWEEVARQVKLVGARDQAKINTLLGSEELRKPAIENGYESAFVSTSGLRVEVLPSHFFWGLHFGWQIPHHTTFLHATCCETEALKLYLAASHGFLQDVDDLYSRPPRILTLGSALSGTQSEIASLMRILLVAANATDRAVMPPLTATLLAPPHLEDGNLIAKRVKGSKTPKEDMTIHRRYIWSVIDTTPLLHPNASVRLLEPDYTTHATPHLVKEGKMDVLAALHDPVDLDLRFQWRPDWFLQTLNEPPFVDAQVVRIITDEGSRGFWSRWGEWELPEDAPMIDLCHEPERMATCAQLCRRPPL